MMHGYLIGDDIQVDVKLGTVIRFYPSRKYKIISVDAVFLSEPAMRLLVYLLERFSHDVVFYNDIFEDIWDSRGLISSYKRLNQVIEEIRKKLKEIGLTDEFIITVRGKGYQVNYPSVRRLYSKMIESHLLELN
ncbi:hypothetical protein C9426_35570 [Serratia sp. S1B]|nr:hypothetical protein C9426_35570 [Serratia sp. S1B]